MGRSQTQKQKKHVSADVKDLKSTIEGMWKQITHGVSDPVKTKFEETLSYFDKMHTVRSKRTLTADEQGVYDRARKVIIAQFEDMFKRAEPAVNARRNMKREHGHDNKHTARKSMHGGGETIWEMAMKFPIWVWDGLKAMIVGILSFFGSVFSEKQKQLMAPFSPSRFLAMVGTSENDPDGAAVKLDGITEKLGASIEKLQRTVVGGVSGAAMASMDMIMNAFSMLPGIGTTLLIWRMFQNLLVIIGASLSVQAGQVDGSNAILRAVKPDVATEGSGGSGGGSGDSGGDSGGGGGGGGGGVVGSGAGGSGGGGSGAGGEGEVAADRKIISSGGGNANTTATTTNTETALRVSRASRALNQSLKRFSGMSARVASLLMKNSKKSNNNNNQKTPRNPLSLLVSASAAASSSLTGYALKPLSISRFIHA
jgi:hypothetical protein